MSISKITTVPYIVTDAQMLEPSEIWISISAEGLANPYLDLGTVAVLQDVNLKRQSDPGGLVHLGSRTFSVLEVKSRNGLKLRIAPLNPNSAESQRYMYLLFEQRQRAWVSLEDDPEQERIQRSKLISLPVDLLFAELPNDPLFEYTHWMS